MGVEIARGACGCTLHEQGLAVVLLRCTEHANWTVWVMPHNARPAGLEDG